MRNENKMDSVGRREVDGEWGRLLGVQLIMDFMWDEGSAFYF